MNPCIGDRQLDPDEIQECDTCDGFKVIVDPAEPEGWGEIPCPDCQRDDDPGDPDL